MGDIINNVGKSFIGVDYVAHTLEIPGEEQLVIKLDGLDCTTFLETTLAFSRCIKKGQSDFQSYCNELQQVRYRDGKIDKYTSRLHYFSDWIYHNTRRGILRDITAELGGKEISFNLNWMSSHPELYRQLQENPSYVTEIRNQENEINKRKYSLIPKSDVKKIYSKLKNGDIIAITTSVKGLDIGHVGFVTIVDGEPRFLHAPIAGSKVQITDTGLYDYLLQIKKHTGIIVLRAE